MMQTGDKRGRTGASLRLAWRMALLCTAMAMAPMPSPAIADDADEVTQEDLKKLREELEAQKQALLQQQKLISNQQNQLNFLKSQMGVSDDPDSTPVTYNLGNGTVTTQGSNGGILKTQDTDQQPVGEAPEEQGEEERPEITVLAEEGGVLTRRGQLVVAPSLEFTHSTSNRFFAQGVEVQDTVFLGFLEVTEAQRNTVTAAMNVRYGVTDRFEVEARVPFVHRSDKIDRTQLTSLNVPTATDQTDGTDLGDIEFAGHYQLTNAPIYTVANLRVKTDTGTSPYDVPFDLTGRPTELSTGSGFWGVQPSFTAIVPSDPVVFFGTAGYTINIKRDINQARIVNLDPTSQPNTLVTIGEVDPGDSINLAFGMGLSLNERSSFSLGFKYDFVFPTEQETTITTPAAPPDPPVNIIGTVESDELHVGSFLVGWAYQISDSVGLNLNFEVGATDDAPDFTVGLRVPIKFDIGAIGD
jgi:hypothetical protein